MLSGATVSGTKNKMFSIVKELLRYYFSFPAIWQSVLDDQVGLCATGGMYKLVIRPEMLLNLLY